jgi:hypothetical protein
MRAPLDSVPGGPKVIRPRITRGLEEVVEGIRGILEAVEAVKDRDEGGRCWDRDERRARAVLKDDTGGFRKAVFRVDLIMREWLSSLTQVTGSSAGYSDETWVRQSYGCLVKARNVLGLSELRQLGNERL